MVAFDIPKGAGGRNLFELMVDDIAMLRQQGVSEEVLLQMQQGKDFAGDLLSLEQ